MDVAPSPPWLLLFGQSLLIDGGITAAYTTPE